MAEDNKALELRLIEEFVSAQDPAKFDEFVAADVVPHHIPPGMPGTAEGWRGMTQAVFGAFPGWKMTATHVIAEGDKVAIRWTVTGKHTGDFMGIPPTGNDVSLNGMIVDRWANGKVVEHWEQFDMMGMMAQLGVV